MRNTNTTKERKSIDFMYKGSYDTNFKTQKTKQSWEWQEQVFQREEEKVKERREEVQTNKDNK